ncbi:MAG TPA: hypothetical protein VFE48_22970 [Methylomirabilota bacterium]|nr:hypothetical protein [Methylomirabilota bacterium]
MGASWIGLGLLVVLVPGCASHEPPVLLATRGQTISQQKADAEDCAGRVHRAAREIGVGLFTTWSAEERYPYLACMEGRGYTEGN